MNQYLFKVYVIFILVLCLCHQTYSYALYDIVGNSTQYDSSSEYNKNEYVNSTEYGKTPSYRDGLKYVYKTYQDVIRSNYFNMTMASDRNESNAYCSKFDNDCDACNNQIMCRFCDSDKCVPNGLFEGTDCLTFNYLCYHPIPIHFDIGPKPTKIRYHFFIVLLGCFKGGLIYYWYRRRKAKAERERAAQLANMESPVTRDLNNPQAINMEVTENTDSVSSVKFAGSGPPYTKFT